MSKKALLIGINYLADPSARLNGCINDINNISDVLVDAYGYALTDIIKLRDDMPSPAQKPTRVNILNQLRFIIANSASCSEIWIHYSGHGSQIRDTNGDEADRLDEVIVPVDYRTSGLISDDELFAIIQNTKCKTMLVFDSCHSGTICDLQWQFDWQNGKILKTLNSNKKITNPNVVCFSGCRDSQTSADAYNNDTKMGVGAFTDTMIACLRMNDHNVDVVKLHMDICKVISAVGFTQTPNLSSSSVVPTYKFVRVSSDKNATVTGVKSAGTTVGTKSASLALLGDEVAEVPITSAITSSVQMADIIKHTMAPEVSAQNARVNDSNPASASAPASVVFSFMGKKTDNKKMKLLLL
jgi:hypothetical protein